MNWDAFGRSIIGGPLCRSKLCEYPDYVKAVMDPAFVARYNPVQTDYTLDPNSETLKTFIAAQKAKGAVSRWKVNVLWPGLKATPAPAEVIGRTWDLIREARNTGHISRDDLIAAQSAARTAMDIRFDESKPNMIKIMNHYLPAETQSYLVRDTDGGWPNWVKSLAAVDEAAGQGKINNQKQKEIKKNMLDFSRDITTKDVQGLDPFAENHVPLLQSYQKGITSNERWLSDKNYKIFDDSEVCKWKGRRRAVEAVMEHVSATATLTKRMIIGLLQFDS